eukprot:CAMPEP_0114363768 /NCGR_PEP_ID=MMETSP0101-20121206/26874_1 /TAXON_ID=38822 ORGANISM="Pteridomonas danica, Strain PT" /NCGR_SAMPLE_ID=MMETSP0101 /ASSEMBLY_ACC=CAM_ASM_000211 /LENGTH=50 /DNA_ID=CAMNT_0001510695 /DNA_START=29 /DNA_END=181 /DNA_ORIENTATION=+
MATESQMAAVKKMQEARKAKAAAKEAKKKGLQKRCEEMRKARLEKVAGSK